MIGPGGPARWRSSGHRSAARLATAALLLVALAAPRLSASGLAAASSAEEPFAGWRQLSTEHFLIIYEPRDALHAERLASFAEDHYRRITTFFDSYPRRIRVVLNGRTDRINGFATSLPPSISLNIAAVAPNFGVVASDWIELVFVHELTHYVHLSMQAGAFHWLAYALGPGGPWLSGHLLPAWAHEGVATYGETAFTDGGRGRGSFFELRSKAAIVEDRLFDFRRASYSSAFPPAQRHYVAGYAIVDYLQRNYGERALIEVMQHYLRFPYFGPWAAIRRVTGERFRDLYLDLRNDLSERYAGSGPQRAPGIDLARASVAGSRGPAGSARTAPPQLFLGTSTERGVLAYRRRLTATPDLVWITGDSIRPLVAVRLDDPNSFTATVDGARVVYSAATQLDTHAVGSAWISDLYELTSDTRARRRITTLGHLWHPALSAAGDVLVAVQGVGPFSRLVRVDQHGGGLTVLAAVANGVMLHPAVSADGALVVFELATGVEHDLYAIATSAAPAPVVRGVALTDHNRRALMRITGPNDFGEYFPSLPRSSVAAMANSDSDRDVTLLFGADPGGALALYAKDGLTQTARLVMDDPVGAYAGLIRNDHLYYASYTSDGHTIRRVPASMANSANLAPSVRSTCSTCSSSPSRPANSTSSTSPASSADLTATATATSELQPSSRAEPITHQPHRTGETQRYLDLPLPAFWFPLPSIVENDGALDLGIGVAFLAASVLGRSTATLQAAYHPSLRQPVGAAELQLAVGRMGIADAVSLDYGVSGPRHTRSLSQAGQLTFALVDEAVRDISVRRYAAVLAAVGYAYAQTAEGVLALAQDEGVAVAATSGALGAELDWYRFGSAKDLFPPLRFSAETRLESSLASWQPVLRAVGSLQLPAFGNDVVRLQATAAHAWSAPLPPSAAPLPRGPFDLGDAGSGRGLFAVDYLMALALLDQPILAGTYLAALAAGVHLEAAIDWSASTVAGVVPYPEVFVGLELGAVLGYGTAVLPVGAGVAVALPSARVAAYVFFGLTPQSGIGAASAS